MIVFTLKEEKYSFFRCGRWLLCSVGLAAPLAALGQERAAVQGTVTTVAQVPVEFATLTLHRAADSVAVKTEFSDARGGYRLEAKAGERYRVSAVQLGFGRTWSPVFELPTAGQQLPALVLLASQATALTDVTVVGRKPLLERRADRTIVNVADSPLAGGATTFDVLGRAPGVTTDAGDNLALRGRQGLLLVVDGKRVPLTGPALADYLRALPAEQLQSIELITNPPASYDAQGGAGVIAINLKKDQRLGTNGTANASYGRGEFGKFTAGLALNHRGKNFNLYGTYAYSDRRGFTRLDFDRQFVASPTQAASRSLVYTDQRVHPRAHNGKVGLDVNLSKRTQLGASLTGLASANVSNAANTTQFFDMQQQPSRRFSAAVGQDIRRPSGSANLNFRHAFADSATARSLSADADYARYHTTRLLDLYTYYETPAQATNLLTGDQRSDLSIGAARVDYSQPLPHRARLEAGAKVTQVVSDNSVAFANTANGVTTPDPTTSSQFTYHENVNAAYANLRGALARTTLQVGLRAEQTNTLAEQAGVTLRERHYLQLFPSAQLEHTLNERHALALLLARRVDRPSYGQVNPLRAYLDATSYSAGNPNLVASTSYNVEVSHTYRQKFTTALAYARTDQPIQPLTLPAPEGGGVVVNQPVNLSVEHFYTLTLTAPLEITKWWTLYANGLAYYNRFVGTINGSGTDRGLVALNLTANNSFTLPGGWTAELNGSYESRQVSNYEETRPLGQVAAGLQRGLWNKQGSLRLTFADIFYTTPQYVTTSYANFTEYRLVRQDSRVVTAAFTYRFGNSKVASARRRAAGAEDELRRASGQ
jgi:ferric enterobactin receptor